MDEDSVIVERVKSGDSQAFSILVNKYKKPVLNLIYRYIGSADQAEDLAQEAFLRAYRALPSFRGDAKFFTWLYKIAANLAIRTRKRNNRFNFQSLEQKVESGSTEVNRALSNEEGPENSIEQKERGERVRRAVMSLPADQRMVVVLYRYENMSYEDIAKTMDISLSAVKSRLHRARKALKENLQEYVSPAG